MYVYCQSFGLSYSLIEGSQSPHIALTETFSGGPLLFPIPQFIHTTDGGTWLSSGPSRVTRKLPEALAVTHHPPPPPIFSKDLDHHPDPSIWTFSEF